MRVRSLGLVLTILPLCAAAQHPSNQHHSTSKLESQWSALGEGTNSTVRVLALDKTGRLYAGGDFTMADGIVANRIARWDGSAWSAFNSDSDLSITGIAVDDAGNLYVGGWIAFPDGHSGTGVARWNGSDWERVGDLEGSIASLALDEHGNLFAGTASSANGEARVMKWDGESWTQIGGYFTGGLYGPACNALAFDSHGNIYAGGTFTAVEEHPAGFVARWDGSAWEALGDGLSSESMAAPGVQTLVLDAADVLYAGGDFNKAAGAPANQVARWDGTAWSPVGDGLPGLIGALTIDPAGTLYAGGIFTISSGIGISTGIARWNGSGWEGLANQIGNSGVIGAGVEALITDPDGNLYLGGHFLSVGALPGFGDNVPANHIAMWSGAASTAQELIEIPPQAFRLAAPYPNPFTSRTSIRLDLAGSDDVTVKVVDVLGREVARLHQGTLAPGTHDFWWDAGSAASGQYTIYAAGQAASTSRRVLHVK